MDTKTQATIFSSEIATDSIAKRLIRDRNKDSKKAIDTVVRILHPISHELARHRKVRRGMLRPLVIAMVADLQKHPGVILLETRIPPRSASTDESYKVQFIQATNITGNNHERWLDFLVVKIATTRKETALSIAPLDFRVNSHVLSRYMQRTRKPIETFFQDIVRPIQMGIVLAGHVAYMEKPEIAVPFANGMLLGSVNVFNQSPTRFVYHMSGKHGSEPPTEEEMSGLIPGGSVECCMLTFLEESGLNDQKTRLYQRLLEFERNEREGIEAIGRIFIFDENSGFHAAPRAVAAAREIVGSPEWLALHTG
jgi:hypothetical protein